MVEKNRSPPPLLGGGNTQRLTGDSVHTNDKGEREDTDGQDRPSSTSSASNVNPFTHAHKHTRSEGNSVTHSVTRKVTALIAAVIMLPLGLTMSATTANAAGTPDFEYAGYNAEEIKSIADCIAGVSTTCPSDKDGKPMTREAWLKWAHKSLEDNVKGSTRLADSNGNMATVSIRLIGVNHDYKSSNNGNAGLTLQSVGSYTLRKMNTIDYSTGGWRDTVMRNWLKTSVLDNNLSVKNNVASVIKMENNITGGNGVDSVLTVTPVNDRLTLASPVEMSIPVSKNKMFDTKPDGSKFTINSNGWYGDKNYDYAGYPYEYWTSKGKSHEDYESRFAIGTTKVPWLRSPSHLDARIFALFYGGSGILNFNHANRTNGVAPTLSF